MMRMIWALILVLVIVSPGLAQQSLVGTYKLVSLNVEIDGKPSTSLMGNAPHGYLVVTPTRFIIFYTADKRKFGTSANEKAALLDSLVGYAGVYRVEGDKFILTPDVSWVENTVGATRVETFQLSGNRLTTILGPEPWPRDPSKTMVNRRVWEKIE